MHQLPQEIVDKVCSLLDYDSLKSVLLLSRKFQFAAEQCSGAFRIFALSIENIDEFIATYSNRRFRYLRQLTFRTILHAPEKSEDPQDWDDDEYKHSYRDSVEDLKTIDENFTRQINSLFSAMKTVELHRCNETVTGNVHLKLETPTIYFNQEMWPLQRSFVSWRVHLLSPEKLPTVTSVRELTMESPNQTWYSNGPEPSLRKLDLRLILDLSGKLLNLSTLSCRVGADELYSNTLCYAPLRYITQDWVGPRKNSRHDFNKSLEGLALHGLRHVCLDFLYPRIQTRYIDQRLPMPDLTGQSLYDPFSTCLRTLSLPLRKMQLRAIADATLFWPIDGSLPSWPNLEHLNVEFYMCTPSGSWYFTRPPGLNLGAVEQGYNVANPELYPPLVYTEHDESVWEDTCEMDLEDAQTNSLQFRVTPNETTILPLLTAFAKAVGQMPRLKTFALWSSLRFSLSHDDEKFEDFDFATVSSTPKHLLYTSELAWGVAYASPRERAFPEKSEKINSGQRRVWWRTGVWRPQADLHALFKEIGKKEHGAIMLDCFDNDGLRQEQDFVHHRYRHFNV